jgi:putative ABC transport system substrate-binding protein
MRRREFIAALGGAAAWPVMARAQQPAMPVIGFLDNTSPAAYAANPANMAAFRQGLKEAGFVEGQNVAIEYRWAEGQYERVPALAADLVRRQVSAIAVVGLNGVRTAKAATATIPIVFMTGADPVKEGLVASLNKPGGNVTGATFLTTTLGGKRLEQLRELLPNAALVGVLVNPTGTGQIAMEELSDIRAAADAVGQKLLIINASTEHDIDAAFNTFPQQHVGAFLVSGDAFFLSRRDQIVALAARNALPAIYPWPEYTGAGGLMSYGTSLAESLRLIGLYTGQILKGTTPADLPVQQSTKVELALNLKTAKTLGITFPITLLARADEVIE